MQKCVGRYQLPTRVSVEEEGAAGRGLAWKGRFRSRPGLLYLAGDSEEAKGFPGLQDIGWQVI